MSLVDYSFLFELAENDSNYIHTVLDIFLNTVPDGVYRLEKLIGDGNWDETHKLAHSLKSSLSVIKINSLYDKLAEIEALSLKNQDNPEMHRLIAEVLETFRQAHPMVIAEADKYKALSQE